MLGPVRSRLLMPPADSSTPHRAAGDTVYLAHCLSDPRTPATAVGSSSAATQWSPARDEQR